MEILNEKNIYLIYNFSANKLNINNEISTLKAFALWNINQLKMENVLNV